MGGVEVYSSDVVALRGPVDFVVVFGIEFLSQDVSWKKRRECVLGYLTSRRAKIMSFSGMVKRMP